MGIDILVGAGEKKNGRRDRPQRPLYIKSSNVRKNMVDMVRRWKRSMEENMDKEI